MLVKSSGFLQVIFRVYLHCWYVPLLAFLLGVKICLISLLVGTVDKSGRTIEPNSNSLWETTSSSFPYGNHGNRNRRLAPSSTISTLQTTISTKILEDWKTLADLENSYISPSSDNRTEASSIWLIFNRIPRCGGETIVDLLIKLSGNNRFSHQEHEYRTPWPRFLLEQEQESLVTWFEYQHLPKSYDRHFYFVNFTRFQKYVKDRPIYINMIREPVQRLRSFFLSKRGNAEIAKAEILRRNDQLPNSGMIWYEKSFEDCVMSSDPECYFENGSQDFTMAVAFFCGQHPACVLINNKWALQRAKFTIEKHYSVVGVLDRLNQTLKILEHYIPRFFTGATESYFEMESKTRRSFIKHTEAISDAVQIIIERKLPAEVELYQFINQRLSMQYDFLLDQGLVRHSQFKTKKYDSILSKKFKMDQDKDDE